MPELPEVEITRRSVEPLLLGRRMLKVFTTKPSYFFLTPPATLRRVLPGRTATALTRLGKYLLAELDDGSRLLLHLGMTGQLFSSTVTSPRLLSSTARASLTPENQRVFQPDEHTHLRWVFADGGPELLFRDVRKFGKVRLLAPGAGDPRLDKLGPDALGILPQHLERAAQRRNGPVKSFLLDQAVLAGVGNIYADEALFLAGVRPLRPASKVRRGEWERLAQAIRAVLERSIATGGSSISDYLHPDGSDGGYQDERRVYGREGEACSTCGKVIERVVIATRSSSFCPRCQR